MRNYANRRNVGHDPIGDPLGGERRRICDPVTAAISASAASGLVGAGINANAASSSANTIANATKNAQGLIQQNLTNLSPNYTPYMNLGNQGVSSLSSMLPDLTHQFNAQDLQSNLAPNYQFMLNQGLGATQMAANVGGGGSTPTTAATQFAENYAGNAYQNAFNNYQTQNTNIYNRLAGIAGIGQTAVTGLSNLATGTATQQANLGVGGAQAQAAGQVGTANALSSGINNATQMYSLSNLLNQNGNLNNNLNNNLNSAQSFPVSGNNLIQGTILGS